MHGLNFIVRTEMAKLGIYTKDEILERLTIIEETIERDPAWLQRDLGAPYERLTQQPSAPQRESIQPASAIKHCSRHGNGYHTTAECRALCENLPI